MKAFLISPKSQAIEAVEVADLNEIKALIGFNTIESDAIGERGDRLYFDEECFLRGSSGRFQIDNVVPVAGKGVIVGTTDDGSTLSDVATGIEELPARIKYL